MNYQFLREEIFGKKGIGDPFDLKPSVDLYKLSKNEAFDFIDRCLIDREVHQLYTVDQIGTGLTFLFSTECSDYAFCYRECDSSRIEKGVLNLKFLYENFFEFYCRKKLEKIGDVSESRIDYLCYMFWDIFTVHPGYSEKRIIDAAFSVMEQVLFYSSNDHVIVSILHGLNHWVYDSKRAQKIVQCWLLSPTTESFLVIDYAKMARVGAAQ